MKLLSTIEGLRTWRRNVTTLALIPTMGNLHAGHYALIRAATNHASACLVTIFINPTQFDSKGDFNRYPKTIDDDLANLEKEKVDAVFIPKAEEMYFSSEQTEILIDSHHKILEGKYREGYFSGVAQIVIKLMNISKPTALIMGKKDYQQYRMMLDLVAYYFYDISVIGVETQRNDLGLALSSRNQYLSDGNRLKANHIYSQLVKVAISCKQQRKAVLLDTVSDILDLPIDYFELYNASLTTSYNSDMSLAKGSYILLIAARAGSVRLLDNYEFNIDN